MNRKIVGIIIGLGFTLGGYAQSEVDAYNLSRNDLKGTARSVSMGGAFGALGGDISGISINPAGIGVYKKSEIVTTLNFQNTKTESNLNTDKINESKFKFNFDNLAFVGSFDLYSDIAPKLNFGFSYNRLKTFDRKYRTQGNNLTQSLARYMTYRSNESNISDPSKLLINFKGVNPDGYNPFSQYDWLAVFGYNGYLTDFAGDKFVTAKPILDNQINNGLQVYEKGYVDTYDFNMGTTFSDIVSVGLTVSVTDLDYRRETFYDEGIGGATNAGFSLDNFMKSEGTGWQLKAGVIVKPIQELRIGLAYHSPTWYDMTDYMSAGMDYDMSEFIDGSKDYPSKGAVWTNETTRDYRFRSPDKFVASIAGVIGQYAIISADYEFTNYKNSTKLFDDDGYILPNNPNNDINRHFTGASTLRIGAEARITPQFSARVGYAWMQSPVQKSLKHNISPTMTDTYYEVRTDRADSHFLLDGDTYHLTWGLGYRFSPSFYTDVAFMYKTQKSEVFAHSFSEKANLKTNTFRGLITIGYRF